MIQFAERPIRAAIFDMDGTMFDTERLRFTTLKQASSELSGQEIGDDVLHGSLGLSAAKARELAQSHYGEDYPYEAIRLRADELELAHVRSHGVPVKSGLYDILERLKRNGALLAVATSSRRAIAEEYLINAGVMKYFDITVCGDEVRQGKPDPEIFLTAAGQLNCLPEQCLMVEDSVNGLLAAIRAGGQAIVIRDIKDPPDDIKAQALRAYESMQDFLSDLAAATPSLPAPDVREAFPQALNDLTVGIHGLGAMGGGYLTQVLSHWDGYTRPREIIGVTGNATLRELVNGFGKYRVRYTELGFDQDIENLRAIDSSDEVAVCQMYAVSELIALCLPEPAIRQQAGLIAKGLAARFEQGGRDLTLLVVLNKVAGAAFVRDCVRGALLKLRPAEEAELILARTHCVETVANRIVSKLSGEAVLRQVRIQFGSFERHSATQPADAEAVLAAVGSPGRGAKTVAAKLNQVSRVAHAWNQITPTLFNSGADMQLYAAKGSPLLERLRQVTPVGDIGQIQAIKNRLLNGPHAIAAWYASLLGYKTIGQGMGDARVSGLVEELVNDEIKPAMLREYPDLAPYIEAMSANFLEHCAASFKDPCQRVGRDPLRKLQRNERVFGSIALAAKHGIATPMLEFGAALALRYAMKNGAADDKECQLIRELMARGGKGVGAVLSYAGNYNGKPYPGLDRDADEELIARVEARYGQLANPLSPRGAGAGTGSRRGYSGYRSIA